MAKARAYRESAEVERPPAFQEYPGMALSAESFRLMSLPERGLLMTLRYYCWCNDSMPAEPGQLAHAVGLQEAAVREHFTPAVRGFFEPAEDDQTRLICPALVRQMERLMLRREAQAKSGRDSARKRREKRNPALGDRDGDRGENGTVRSTAEQSTAQQNRNQLGKGAGEGTASKGNGTTSVPDPFVADYEAAQAREVKQP